MTLPNNINIDILDFIKTGKFDYLKLGQTKNWILYNFPDPDSFGIGESLMDAEIWFYGNIELHFDKDELILIFTDNIEDLDGGKSLKLNKWILDGSNKLTLSYFISKLNFERIDFSKRTGQFDLEYIWLKITNSNIELTFVDEEKKLENPNEYNLSSISLLRQ